MEEFLHLQGAKDEMLRLFQQSSWLTLNSLMLTGGPRMMLEANKERWKWIKLMEEQKALEERIRRKKEKAAQRKTP